LKSLLKFFLLLLALVVVQRQQLTDCCCLIRVICLDAMLAITSVVFEEGALGVVCCVEPVTTLVTGVEE
jgi:hypothetical protein